MPTAEYTKIWRARHASRTPYSWSTSWASPGRCMGTSLITCVRARKVLVETPEGLPRSERPQRRQIRPVLDVNTSKELTYWSVPLWYNSASRATNYDQVSNARVVIAGCLRDRLGRRGSPASRSRTRPSAGRAPRCCRTLRRRRRTPKSGVHSMPPGTLYSCAASWAL